MKAARRLGSRTKPSKSNKEWKTYTVLKSRLALIKSSRKGRHRLTNLTTESGSCKTKIGRHRMWTQSNLAGMAGEPIWLIWNSSGWKSSRLWSRMVTLCMSYIMGVVSSAWVSLYPYLMYTTRVWRLRQSIWATTALCQRTNLNSQVSHCTISWSVKKLSMI